MFEKIKALADEAIALQNKNRMDEVLREISKLCDAAKPVEMPVEMEVVTVKESKKGAKNGK